MTVASVIIPAYNAEKSIESCLTALHNQTGLEKRPEIIVVDDGSTDDTSLIVKKHEGVVLIQQKNAGPGAARNAGVQAARGRFLLFTDSDCTPAQNWVAEMIKAFEIANRSGILSNGTTKFGTNGILIDALADTNCSLQMVEGDSVSSILYWRVGNGIADTLYAQFVDTLGVSQWAPKDTIWAGGAQIADMAAYGNPDGSSFIAYVVNNDSIYINKINKNGTKAWTDSGVAVALAGTSPYNLDIVSDGAGGAILVFGNNGGVNLGAQNISSGGAAQWTLGGVSISSNISGGLKVISDGAGGVIVAWVDNRNGNSDIYAQNINSGGSKAWGGSDVAVCMETSNQSEVNIASDGAGGVYIVWKDERAGWQGIYSQRLNSSGVKQFSDIWEMPVTFIPNAFNIHNINIIPDGAGNAILAWTHDQDIRAQKLWPNGLLFDGNMYKIKMTDIYGDPGDTLTANIITDETFLVSDSILSITFGLDALDPDTIITIIGLSALPVRFSYESTSTALNSAIRLELYPPVGTCASNG